jgi:hypothetical protein
VFWVILFGAWRWFLKIILRILCDFI